MRGVRVSVTIPSVIPDASLHLGNCIRAPAGVGHTGSEQSQVNTLEFSFYVFGTYDRTLRGVRPYEYKSCVNRRHGGVLLRSCCEKGLLRTGTPLANHLREAKPTLYSHGNNSSKPSALQEICTWYTTWFWSAGDKPHYRQGQQV